MAPTDPNLVPQSGSKTYGRTIASGNVQLQQGDNYTTNITNITNASSPQDDRELEAFLKALDTPNPADYREDYPDSRGKRVDGTCEWIRKNETYLQWKDSSSSLLWIRGGPGKGKTVLSMFISETLNKETTDKFDAATLEIYCGYQDERRNSSVAIVKSLIWQLLNKHPRLWSHVRGSYSKQSDFLTSFRAQWRVLKAMMCDPTLSQVYCVIDGLDECHEESLSAFLKNITALHGGDRTRLRVVILSRSTPEVIEDHLGGFPTVDLDNDEEARSHVEADVKKLVQEAISRIEKKHKSLPRQLRDAIEQSLQKGAQGSFLWVGVVSEELSRVKLTKLRNVLDSFHPTLDVLFSRIIDNIPADIRMECAKILRWVAFVIEPLTVAQLAQAVEISIPPETGLSHEETLQDILQSMSSLLTFKKSRWSSRELVELRHQSIREYFLHRSENEAFSLVEERDNDEIADRCLRELENAGKEGFSRDYQSWNYYAENNWPHHAKRLVLMDCRTFAMSRPFYTAGDAGQDTWTESYWETNEPLFELFTRLYYTQEQPDFSELVSFLGITTLLRCILKEQDDNAQVQSSEQDIAQNERPSLLWWAAAGGEAAVGTMEFLLKETKDDPSLRSLKYSALHVASGRGSVAGVELLLAQGLMESNSKDVFDHTPLWNAAAMGQTKLVELLLSKYGAYVNSKGPSGQTALHAATSNGYNPTVKYLLEQKDIDVNARDDYGSTALENAATALYNDGLMKLLLEHGADPNIRNNEGETALYRLAFAMPWSSSKGSFRAAGVLLDSGVDPNTPNSEGKTPLMLAAHLLANELIQRLLESQSVDPNLKDKDGRTALSLAMRSERDYPDCLDLVLKAFLADPRVDLESKDNRGWTPLFAASTRYYPRSDKYVDELLKSGRVDPNSQDLDGRTALSYAAEIGQVAIMGTLLRHGAEADQKDARGRSPLWWAKHNYAAKERWFFGDEYDYEEAVMHRIMDAVRLLEGRDDIESNPKDNDGLAPGEEIT